MTCVALPLITLLTTIFLVSVAQGEAAAFGPPSGAKLSVEKLSTIANFINGEIAAQRIPGAIVLVGQHGKPVYLRWFGLRDSDKAAPMTVVPRRPMTVWDLLLHTSGITYGFYGDGLVKSALAVMQDAPSGRMHVNTTIKKIVYDAFEK